MNFFVFFNLLLGLLKNFFYSIHEIYNCQYNLYDIKKEINIIKKNYKDDWNNFISTIDNTTYIPASPVMVIHIYNPFDYIDMILNSIFESYTVKTFFKLIYIINCLIAKYILRGIVNTFTKVFYTYILPFVLSKLFLFFFNKFSSVRILTGLYVKHKSKKVKISNAYYYIKQIREGLSYDLKNYLKTYLPRLEQIIFINFFLICILSYIITYDINISINFLNFNFNIIDLDIIKFNDISLKSVFNLDSVLGIEDIISYYNVDIINNILVFYAVGLMLYTFTLYYVNNFYLIILFLTISLLMILPGLLTVVIFGFYLFKNLFRLKMLPGNPAGEGSSKSAMGSGNNNPSQPPFPQGPSVPMMSDEYDQWDDSMIEEQRLMWEQVEQQRQWELILEQESQQAEQNYWQAEQLRQAEQKNEEEIDIIVQQILLDSDRKLAQQMQEAQQTQEAEQMQQMQQMQQTQEAQEAQQKQQKQEAQERRLMLQAERMNQAEQRQKILQAELDLQTEQEKLNPQAQPKEKLVKSYWGILKMPTGLSKDKLIPSYILNPELVVVPHKRPAPKLTRVKVNTEEEWNLALEKRYSQLKDKHREEPLFEEPVYSFNSIHRFSENPNIFHIEHYQALLKRRLQDEASVITEVLKKNPNIYNILVERKKETEYKLWCEVNSLNRPLLVNQINQQLDKIKHHLKPFDSNPNMVPDSNDHVNFQDMGVYIFRKSMIDEYKAFYNELVERGDQIPPTILQEVIDRNHDKMSNLNALWRSDDCLYAIRRQRKFSELRETAKKEFAGSYDNYKKRNEYRINRNIKRNNKGKEKAKD